MQELENLKEEIYKGRKATDSQTARGIDKIRWSLEVYLKALARQEAANEGAQSWLWQLLYKK